MSACFAEYHTQFYRLLNSHGRIIISPTACAWNTQMWCWDSKSECEKKTTELIYKHFQKTKSDIFYEVIEQIRNLKPTYILDLTTIGSVTHIFALNYFTNIYISIEIKYDIYCFYY